MKGESFAAKEGQQGFFSREVPAQVDEGNICIRLGNNPGQPGDGLVTGGLGGGGTITGVDK